MVLELYRAVFTEIGGIVTKVEAGVKVISGDINTNDSFIVKDTTDAIITTGTVKLLIKDTTTTAEPSIVELARFSVLSDAVYYYFTYTGTDPVAFSNIKMISTNIKIVDINRPLDQNTRNIELTKIESDSYEFKKIDKCVIQAAGDKTHTYVADADTILMYVKTTTTSSGHIAGCDVVVPDTTQTSVVALYTNGQASDYDPSAPDPDIEAVIGQVQLVDDDKFIQFSVHSCGATSQVITVGRYKKAS